VRGFIVVGLLLVRSGCGTSPSVSPASQTSAPAKSRPDDPLIDLEKKVFDEANRQRRLRGISELQWNDAVAEQARSHSINMMQRGFFSHSDPERGALVARLDAVGIRWTRCGENIYREKGLDDPVRSGVEGWMRSPEHRKSLLDPLFSQSGVGIAISPDTDYFITQIFIHPK